MTPKEIRDLRKSLKMSADQFAEALELTGKNRSLSVYRWEKGLRKPSPQTLKLMKYL